MIRARYARARGRAAQEVRERLLRRGILLERLSEDDRRFRIDLVDASAPAPQQDRAGLRADDPLLAELRARYADVDAAVRTHSRWRDERVQPWLDLRHFRGDNSYVWHYREGLRLTRLKYLLYAKDVERRDAHGLLGRLTEDGAFGCWTYRFADMPLLSRDLLDSVNELLFLDRHLGVLAGGCPRVLDIGAGYGRLAHRYVEACDGVTAYRCTDAIPESTYLSVKYLEHRGMLDVAGVVPLDEVEDLSPGTFDLAANVHSWSECPLAAIRWWVDHLARLDVPRIFVVPNEREGFLSLEPDGRRSDFGRVLEAAGYALVVDEPAIADPAVREELDLHDRHCLFERRP